MRLVTTSKYHVYIGRITVPSFTPYLSNLFFRAGQLTERRPFSRKRRLELWPSRGAISNICTGVFSKPVKYCNMPGLSKVQINS